MVAKTVKSARPKTKLSKRVSRMPQVGQVRQVILQDRTAIGVIKSIDEHIFVVEVDGEIYTLLETEIL